MGLTGTVTLIAVATGMAGSTGIPGIYQDHGDASGQRLVGDKLPQLEEGPTHALPALRVANRYSLVDTSKVFESECLARRSSFGDQRLADDMIGMAGKDTKVG